MQIFSRWFHLLLSVIFLFVQTPLGAAETASPALQSPTTTATISAVPPATGIPQTLSLDYTDANLPTVLKSIAYSYDLNLVIGTNIKGKVTAQLKNVSLDEALNAILRLNGYGFTRKENIVYVVPQSEIELTTEFIPLNYMVAKDAQGLLTKSLSKRGMIQINEATNTLVVSDLPENLKSVREMLKGVDQPPLQVLIEAKIVDITHTDAQNIGTTINATYSPDSPHVASVEGAAGAEGSRGVGGMVKLVPSFKYLTETDVTIDALVQQERARVLASPSIATLTGQEARIIIGSKYPYKETSVTGSTTTTSTKFLEVGTTLKVIPMVSPDGWITMKVHPEVSSAAESTDGPLVSTREADATVRVKDNETIVIGGLISQNDTSSANGVPGLRSIPVLGWFFKRHVSRDVKTELVVFITPRIMRSPGARDRAATSAPAEPAVKIDVPSEVHIDADVLNQDPEMLAGLLSYVSDLENNEARKKKDNLALNLELLKTYKMILKEFPRSSKGDYCLFKIASLYVKDFGKCGAAQEALTQMEDKFPQSPYLDVTQSLVQTCPQEAFIIKEEPMPSKKVQK